MVRTLRPRPSRPTTLQHPFTTPTASAALLRALYRTHDINIRISACRSTRTRRRHVAQTQYPQLFDGPHSLERSMRRLNIQRRRGITRRAATLQMGRLVFVRWKASPRTFCYVCPWPPSYKLSPLMPKPTSRQVGHIGFGAACLSHHRQISVCCGRNAPAGLSLGGQTYCWFAINTDLDLLGASSDFTNSRHLYFTLTWLDEYATIRILWWFQAADHPHVRLPRLVCHEHAGTSLRPVADHLSVFVLCAGALTANIRYGGARSAANARRATVRFL